MLPYASVHCFLLAGGRSRRMGSPKAGLRLQMERPGSEPGPTFLEIVSRVADAVFDDVIAVQRHGEEAVPGLVTVYERAHDDEAPIFGVARALEHAPAACFVLAIDYPLITVPVLQELRRRFEASEAPLLVPVWRGIAQTLCAGYGPSMREIVDASIASRRYDLRSLTGAAELVVVDDPALMNVNTTEELEEARRIHGQRLLASR